PSQPFGNAPRNNVRGPNFWQFDAAASKNVALGGAAKLQIRLEAFNLFNRDNFVAPASNRSAANFGTITGTFDARQVQLGVKVLWKTRALGRIGGTERRVRSANYTVPPITTGQIVAFYLFDVAESIDLPAIAALVGSSAVAARLAPKPPTPAYV